MKLDPKAKALLTAIAAAGEPAIDAVPLEKARQQVEMGYSRMKIPVKEVASIRDVEITEGDQKVPLRVYTPEGTGPFPVIIFFHGGGWVFFKPADYDAVCTHLCSATGFLLFSVDYRRSPEFKFPAAINDCLHAAYWISNNGATYGGDLSAVFLAGDSAGGNLAAVTAIRLRDDRKQNPNLPNIQLAGQVLIYPVTDYWLPEKPSLVEFAEGYSLTRDAMKWFWNHYLENDSEVANPHVSPLKTPDLADLPPTLVIVSGFDPLKDEGILYASQLKEAGNDVKLSVYEDMIHGFISYLGIFRQGLTAINEIADWTKQYR